MKKFSIDFLVVVYNNFEDTYEFCKSLVVQKSSDLVDIRCFIIDNSDKLCISKALMGLEKEFAIVFYVKTPDNLGYFGAFNYVFENFSVRDSNFVVLCNNDLVLDQNFINILAHIDAPKDCHVICPNVIAIDGRRQNPHVLNKYSLHKRLILDIYFTSFFLARMLSRFKFAINSLSKNLGKSTAVEEYDIPTEIHMGIGACYVLTNNFLNLNNKLTYPYFLYGEEAYLTNQVHSKGGKIYYYSNLVVHHLESATLSKLPKKTTYDYAREGYWSYRRFY